MKDDLIEKASILVVDDVPRNIQVVGYLLQEKGYEIEFATSGEEALDWLSTKDFDLILLDIMMPGMDGFEVCRKLKDIERNHDIPVVFLTAKSDSDSIVKGFSVGGVDYITKPFLSEELIARVETHIRLRKQKIELAEINATKDKFFSIISHDLKNPFNAIIGFTDLLLNEYRSMSPEQLENYIHYIYQGAKTAFDLLNNLLVWSRSQTGRLEYKPWNFSLGDAVKEVLELYYDSTEKKNITLKNRIPKEVRVYADREMVSTIIRNLVSNAIKFTPKGGEIYVDYKILDVNCLEVSVSDTGVGIAQDKINNIFRLDRGYSTRGTEKESGTGLGLILCKEFVRKHGGEMQIESKEGKGSIFRFTLCAEKN
ncbi:MAG: hybrid sensor histidine kinase/response regulator [Leptospiraceae bacterium]|nr:hybrid sensor histidine kinase/response regulator [Leptospiraceae bacterium]